MARIDGKPSRRRPGYTPEDVRRAKAAQANPSSSRGKALAETRGVDRRVVGIADVLLRDESADEPQDRNG